MGSSVADRPARNYATGRVGLSPPEQQDRLTEQLCAQPCSGLCSAELFEQSKEVRDGSLLLLGFVGRCRLGRRELLETLLMSCFSLEGREAYKQVWPRRAWLSDDGAVAMKELQVEGSVVNALDPLGHALPADTVGLTDFL
jgi:hypothetical protein